VPEQPVEAAAVEPTTVKVYAVPDLVATAEAPAAANPLLAHPEFAEAMQQLQMQTQLIQASMQAAADSAPAEPSGDLVKKLERLKKALRVAAPKESWQVHGGDGEIEIYPDGLCLIIRQTPAHHEAIADLLSQLRAAQSVQIELTVELLQLEGLDGEDTADFLQLLNRALSEDELAKLRESGAKTGMSSVVRIPNGRTAATGLIGMPMQFTAVASADRKSVEFRGGLSAPYDDDIEPIRQALAQSRSVSAGKTIAYLLGQEGVVIVVTPKVLD
jgi:hypothetical protein